MPINFLKIEMPGMPAERAKVKTERFLLDSLLRYASNQNNVVNQYIFVDFLWVESIISLGIENTQIIIDKLFDTYKKDLSKFCFINQHISAENIDWKNGIVFSCHANQKNKFLSIPHKPTVFCDDKIADTAKNNFKYFFSFVGSLETHQIRKDIFNFNYERKDIFLKDTGGWHFYNRKMQNEIDYKEVLKKSLFCLCPRGTGHGTIRLFEVLKSGSIPVIISDEYKLPPGLINNINCIVISEKNILKIEKILCSINKEKINSMLEGVNEYREKYLCFENFEYSILSQIK